MHVDERDQNDGSLPLKLPIKPADGTAKHVKDLESRRLLLGNTVKGSTFLNKVQAIDGNDLAIREKLTDDAEGALVIF
jgi:hypothetical protein